MRNELTPNKYKAGDHVYAKKEPTLELVIRRYVDRVYYCQIEGNPEQKELVYYERELVENPAPGVKNKKAQTWENEGGAP